MKKLLMIVVLLVSASAVFGQAGVPKQSGPVMTWDKSTHDFGNIVQGDVVEHTFKFTNSGNEPLIITNVQVSCGCTTPKGWPRDPVMPGGTGELTVAFNSTGKMGAQTKPVIIISNAVNDTKIVFNTVVLDKKPQ
ncbi:DUF1573 domain-containing protein [Chryseotalea sanaruensis]|uniref:DUF1573 domain-containing protein n=1 Tax=Chryseotalea sanaruensis TaxID=2482724 RepID=A0A401U9F7_9BACT|nr:DUF1573 domain-containing protein [Chryseotalea sanaruensis]GCC51521.1 DUF1573 domain-containing protein [Chryseotalea sanaruensis]